MTFKFKAIKETWLIKDLSLTSEFFLPLLLPLLLGQLQFCFSFFGTKSFFISIAEFRDKEVTINFFGYFL